MKLWMYPEAIGWFVEDRAGQWWRVPHEPNGWEQRRAVTRGVDAPTGCGLYRLAPKYAQVPIMTMLGVPL